MVIWESIFWIFASIERLRFGRDRHRLEPNHIIGRQLKQRIEVREVVGTIGEPLGIELDRANSRQLTVRRSRRAKNMNGIDGERMVGFEPVLEAREFEPVRVSLPLRPRDRFLQRPVSVEPAATFDDDRNRKLRLDTKVLERVARLLKGRVPWARVAGPEVHIDLETLAFGAGFRRSVV